MGRLSKRTIQCRAARKQRDLHVVSKPDQQQLSSGSSRSSGSLLCLGSSSTSSMGIDLSKLGVASLRRYQAAFGLDPALSNADLLWGCQHHFNASQVQDERGVVLGFAQAWRQRGYGRGHRLPAHADAGAAHSPGDVWEG